MNTAWLGPLVLALAAIALYLDRRRLASMQASILGGSIAPGCVVAEALLLILLAAAMLLFATR